MRCDENEKGGTQLEWHDGPQRKISNMMSTYSYVGEREEQDDFVPLRSFITFGPNEKDLLKLIESRQ